MEEQLPTSQIAEAASTVVASPAPQQVPKSTFPKLLRDFGISFFFSLCVILFLCQSVRVEGNSMLPQLKDRNRLIINKIAYRVGPIHHGDVVVFRYPYDQTKTFIKRVIAGPGDDVFVDHGTVYVNGRKLVEEYVPARYADGRSMSEMVVPDHEYFVMGDHRSDSIDSRRFGPVGQDLIYGKAVFVYWPLEQAGVVH